MNTDEFYMTLASRDQINIYPTNNSSRFTLQLPSTLELSDEWRVALVEVIHRGVSGSLTVTSDLVEHRVYAGDNIPLLAYVPAIQSGIHSTSIANPYYCQLASLAFHSITFNIAADVDINVAHIILVLHFKRDMNFDSSLALVLDSTKDNGVFGNTASSFTNILPYEMYCEKNMYEVGLVDLTYISADSPQRQVTVSMFLVGPGAKDEPDGKLSFTFKHPTDLTQSQFIQRLNTEIEDWCLPRPMARVPQYRIEGGFMKQDPGKWIADSGEYDAGLMCDPESVQWFKMALTTAPRTLPRLYSVFCSVVEPSFVGQTREKVLRLILADRTDFGFHVKYSTPYYIPLAETMLGSIKIELRDVDNNIVDLTSGRTIVTLHVRERYR